MYLRLLKERLSFTLVVVIAGLGPALITGNELVAAAVAVLVILGTFAVIARRYDTRSRPDEGRAKRQRGAPFTYDFAWKLDDRPDLVSTMKSLEECGLQIDSSEPLSAGVALKGGSHLRTRLLGGYFVNPRYLPLRAQLTMVTNGPHGITVKLLVQDTLKIAVRDEALERRYRQAVERIRAAVEDGLSKWHPVPVPSGS